MVASIDFGDSTCDEWAIKTWDVDVFPEYPDGSIEFSVFDYKKEIIGLYITTNPFDMGEIFILTVI